jgi:hypothetical protein|tara:strand:- start:932 stop:1123 length:192 start_codon:yes stop_codon:yes gene_type:complete
MHAKLVGWAKLRSTVLQRLVRTPLLPLFSGLVQMQRCSMPILHRHLQKLSHMVSPRAHDNFLL